MGEALTLPGVDTQPRELVSRRLMRVTLRDKPVGYSLGEYRGRVLQISLCPLCGDPGVHLSELLVAHMIDILGERGDAKFQKQDTCKLEWRNLRGYGPLLPNGRF